VRREILSGIRDKIVQGNAFPFRKIGIRLRPASRRMAREFAAGFLEGDSLQSSVRALLESEHVPAPGLEITVELSGVGPAAASSGPARPFDLQFRDPVAAPAREIPVLLLEILKGSAQQQVYRMEKERILIGCLPEVEDREGRLVRKNDIVFPHRKGDVNTTIASMHARIWFDAQKREYRIMDESSRYGTRIVRRGCTIEVPADNLHGVGLCSGDEVCFGQASLRFILAGKTG